MDAASIIGGIFKVVKAIVKAANEARQCKRRCLDLADRAEDIADLLRESEAPNDDESATRTRVLDRLRDALEEAHQIVQSCSSRSFSKLLLAGGSTSGSIDNVERKINNCLLELGVANNNVRLGLGLGLGNQQTTTARRVGVHDAVPRPKPNIVVNSNSGIIVKNSGILNMNINNVARTKTIVNISGRVVYFEDSSRSRSRSGSRTKEDSHVTTIPMRGKLWDHKNWQATAGERIQKAAAAAPGTRMLSTTRPAAAEHGEHQAEISTPGDQNPTPAFEAWRSMENHVSFPAFKAHRSLTLPSQGLQACQHPYGGAGNHGVVPYNYNHYSVEEDPNSCTIM